MKAHITKSYGPNALFEVADIPIPNIEAGEILIEVKATSLNPLDNKLLRQDIGVNPILPAVLHGDVAGIVAKVGPNSQKFKVGDEVYACAGGFIGTAGALAEFMPADERLVAHKPKSLDFAAAAALPLVVLTAWESLIDSANIQEGEHVLIHGGTGGVGHVAIQLAKAKGARVATTVSSDEKAKIALSLGADDIINYQTESVEDYTKRLTAGKGFDVVYDTVSGNTFEGALQAVRNRGRVVAIFTGTDSTTFDIMNLFLRAATIHAQNMSLPLLTGEGREHHGEILREAAMLVDTGKLKPLIDPNQFTFDQINEAHALYESKRHIGKIVLTQ